MNLRKAIITAAAYASLAAPNLAGPPVEIVSLAGPHGTAPQQWLQRLAEAGAGSTRVVSGGNAEPRLDDLGATAGGAPLVKVYAVLDRDGVLLLPAAEGPKRFKLSDRTALKDYFTRLATEGASAVTVPRGKYGLTEAEFTDLFTRLHTPLPRLSDGATLGDAITAAEKSARVTIDVDGSVREVLKTKSLVAASVEGLATGTALAAILRQEALAFVPTPAARAGGSGGSLKVVATPQAKDAWPVGYEPEGTPTQTAPGLMEFLTVEVEGYTFAEALEAIGPRVTWQERPLPIVWDHFAMRRDAIDPATAEVRFPRRRTFYKSLLDKLASQARMKLDLRVDEAGTPFLWLTR